MWTAERWRRIEQLFEAALARPAAERDEFVASSCGDDSTLRAQVERMLEADRIENGVVDGTAIPSIQVDPFVGATFGNWRLESKIAEGGMGSVYRAMRADGSIPRPVAVKLLHVGLLSDTMRRRFLREPRLLGRIEHKNIARLLDGGATADGVPYIVMELVDGEHLDRFCDERRLTLRERLGLFETICLAADHAHRSLVLHRDLKPSNILVTRDGEPRIVDFGVAALLREGEGEPGETVKPPTGTNPAAYTPEYASPEQMRGGAVGIASDVWSLGVVLHELLTGTRPFSQGEIRAIANGADASTLLVPPSARVLSPATEREKIVARAAARGLTPEKLARSLLGDLDRIVGMALESEPARRYRSCLEFAADVRRHLDGFPVVARPPSTWYRIERFASRHRVATSLGIALMASLLGGTIVSLSFARSATRERDDAERARKVAIDQANHASIEAESSAQVTDALTDVFLKADFYEEPQLRDRVRERLLQQATDVRKKYATDPHVLANLIDALGTAARHVGLRDEAKALIEEALEIRVGFFGDDHLEHALSLGNLGALELEEGNAVAARDTLAQALRIHRLHPREVHSDIARAMNDLAAATAACGDFKAAYELHRDALAIREKEFPGSLSVAESRNNLGAALLRLGMTKEARENLDIAYDLRRRILGDDAYLTLQCLANRGSIELKDGDLPAARADFERAIEGMRKLRGAGAEALAILLPRLAQVALAQKDLAGAKAALDEAVVAATKQFHADHPRTADTISQRAALHRLRGEYEDAVADWVEVLRIRTIALPKDHPTLAATRYELGLARADAKDDDHALLDLQASIDARPQDDAGNAAAHCALGKIHVRRRDWEAAERELTRAQKDVSSDAKELRAAIMKDLAAVYRATGRPELATKLENDGN